MTNPSSIDSFARSDLRHKHIKLEIASGVVNLIALVAKLSAGVNLSVEMLHLGLVCFSQSI